MRMPKAATTSWACYEKGIPSRTCLSDDIMKRIHKLYTEQLEDIDIHQEQLTRWRRENRLTSEQDREIARLEQVLHKWREAATEILALHAEMKDHTIDKILEMDDVELGLEALRRTGLASENIDIARHIDS